jgi:hypothetical protein
VIIRFDVPSEFVDYFLPSLLLLLLLLLLLWLYSPLLGLVRFFSFLILYTFGRILLMGDQPVARPLQNNINTE